MRILLLLLLSLSAFAKNPCDRITVHKDNLRGFTAKYSPPLLPVGIKRVTYEDGRDTTYLSIMISKPGIMSYDYTKLVKGAYILFDNDAYRDYEAYVYVLPMATPIEKTIYACSIPLTDKLLAQLKAGVVKKVGLSGFERVVTEKESKYLLDYYNCVTAP